MKILHIQFSNINALKGSHKVDFTQQPLSEAGLFAITGSTGSGKTTLLDVISLALYNQVPRLGRISRSVIEQSGAVLTRHTQEASAEVKYQCAEGIFISRWRISTARTGNLRDYDMEIATSDGTLLAIKRSEVPAQNEALIGLSYDQFIRSTLLAQGDFAKFLSSTKDERNALLEQITGTDIYRQLSKRAYEKYTAGGKELEQLKRDRESAEADVADPEEITAWQSEKAQQEQKEAQLRKNLDTYKSMLTQWAEWEQKQADLQKALEAQRIAQAKADEFHRAEGERLRKHEALLPLEETIEAWKTSKKALQDQEKTLQAAIQKVSQLETAKEKTKQAVEQLLGTAVAEEKVVAGLQQLSDTVERLDNKRSELRSNYAVAKDQARRELEDADVDWDGKVSATVIRMFRENRDIFAKKMQQLSISWPEGAIENVKLLRQQLDTQLQWVGRGQHLQEKRVNIRQDAVQAAEELDTLTGELEQLPMTIELAEKEAANLELEIQKLEAEQRNAILEKKLEDLRHELKAGEPCPLCGALEHPYAGTTPSPHDDGALDRARKERDHVREKVIQRKERYKIVQSTKEELTKKIGALEEKLLAVDSELNELRQQAGLDDDTSWEKMEQTLQSQRDQLDQWEMWHSRMRAIQRALPHLEQMQQAQIEGRQLSEEIDALYQGEDVKKDTRQLEQQWSTEVAQLEEALQTLKACKTAEKDARSRWNTVHDQLSAGIQPLGYQRPEEVLQDWLPGQQYRALNERQQALTQAVNTAKSKVQHLEKEVEAKGRGLEGKEKSALVQDKETAEQQWKGVQDRLQWLHTQLDFQNRLQQKIEDLTAQIEKEEKANRKWQLLNAYIGSASGDKFVRFAQSLTLKQLTLLANQRLRQFSPRYLLDTPQAAEDDSLIVIDRDMGDERRSVKTLSGGETFLVSLALALALSDLASQQVRIETIFIDEGFGTLDPEVLDQTLDVLEQLQMQDQKTIGIISHVSALKDRITAQIQLQQDGQGHSHLRVVGS